MEPLGSRDPFSRIGRCQSPSRLQLAYHHPAACWNPNDHPRPAWRCRCRCCSGSGSGSGPGCCYGSGPRACPDPCTCPNSRIRSSPDFRVRCGPGCYCRTSSDHHYGFCFCYPGRRRRCRHAMPPILGLGFGIVNSAVGWLVGESPTKERKETCG